MKFVKVMESIKITKMLHQNVAPNNILCTFAPASWYAYIFAQSLSNHHLEKDASKRIYIGNVPLMARTYPIVYSACGEPESIWRGSALSL